MAQSPTLSERSVVSRRLVLFVSLLVAALGVGLLGGIAWPGDERRPATPIEEPTGEVPATDHSDMDHG
jgi:hypothetical protein